MSILLFIKDNENDAEVPVSSDYLTKEELDLMASAETKNDLAKQALFVSLYLNPNSI